MKEYWNRMKITDRHSSCENDKKKNKNSTVSTVVGIKYKVAYVKYSFTAIRKDSPDYYRVI